MYIFKLVDFSIITLNLLIPFPGVPDAPYWVLSTDYQSYSLVYSCADYFGLFHIDFAWILARTRVLTEDFLGQLHEKLAAAGVKLSLLTVSNQTGCDIMSGDISA